jgi:hypothetical protein
MMVRVWDSESLGPAGLTDDPLATAAAEQAKNN